MLTLAVVATAATEPAPSPSINKFTEWDDPGLSAAKPSAVRHARIRLDPGGGRPAVTAELRLMYGGDAVEAMVVRESDRAAMALEPLRESGQAAVLGYTFDPFASLDPASSHDETFEITLTATAALPSVPGGSAYSLGATAEYGGPPPTGASLTVTITDASPWPPPSGGSPAASGP
jgi:hypothetical protein